MLKARKTNRNVALHEFLCRRAAGPLPPLPPSPVPVVLPPSPVTVPVPVQVQVPAQQIVVGGRPWPFEPEVVTAPEIVVPVDCPKLVILETDSDSEQGFTVDEEIVTVNEEPEAEVAILEEVPENGVAEWEKNKIKFEKGSMNVKMEDGRIVVHKKSKVEMINRGYKPVNDKVKFIVWEFNPTWVYNPKNKLWTDTTDKSWLINKLKDTNKLQDISKQEGFRLDDERKRQPRKK